VVAPFYAVMGASGAAAARLLDLTSRYPLFSEADQANMMLAQIYQKTEHNDFAARFYAKVVRDYPLSNLAPEARRRLIALGYPVPQPDPKALARMQEEGKYIHQRAGMVRQALGMLRSGPDISRSAHYGEPNLTPDSDIISARQVLVPSVVSMAAAGSGIGSNTVSASAVSSGFSAPVNPAANSVVANSSDASDSGTTSTAAPSSSDPAKGPPANGKNARPSAKAKKKKGLFHKIVPF
jgi:outer membrane protein assembly factor BamD